MTRSAHSDSSDEDPAESAVQLGTTGLGWPRAMAEVSRETEPGLPLHTTVKPQGSTDVSRETQPEAERGVDIIGSLALSAAVQTAPRLSPQEQPPPPAPPNISPTPVDPTPEDPTPKDHQTLEDRPDPKHRRSLQRPQHTRIITIANQKGGVGKTTTTVNVAAALAQEGLSVLVLDLDPQGNASTALGIPHHEGVQGIYDVLIDDMPLEQAIVAASSVEGVWCAPSTVDVAGCEIELVGFASREFRLHTALRAHIESLSELSDSSAPRRYDYVLIDCPPSLGLLTINAFAASTEVLIPIQCEYYALEGLTQLVRNVDLIRANLNPHLRVSTILMTMFDARTRLSAQVAAEVRGHFGDVVLATSIPRSVRISEAPSHGETVLTYDPSSVGALSYREVAIELSQRSATGFAATGEGQE